MFKRKNIFVAIYATSVLIFIIHLLYTKTAVYGDGRLYYSYLPTYLLDHALSFQKAFDHFGINTFASIIGPANIYPIGPAIFWSIPFTLANIILIPFGNAVGYGPVYDLFIGIWNISFVFAGIYLLRITLLKFFDENLSDIASIGIFTTTNLLFYGAIDVINSHSASFFFACLFIYLFTRKRTFKNSIFIGLSIGMLALIRSQDYLFLIFPALEFIKERRIIYTGAVAFTAFLLFLPQILLWHIYFGGILTNPYLKVAGFNFLNPHIFGVLFNSGSGIIWTPILFLCFIGLIKYFKKNTYIALSSVLFILIQIYIISAWKYWWEGASYSARMLISSLPFLAIGLANFLNLERIKQRRMEIIYLFSFLNVLLILFFLQSQ